jgi:hypothetical protein
MTSLTIPKEGAEDSPNQELRSLYAIVTKENQFKVFEAQHESAPPILFK